MTSISMSQLKPQEIAAGTGITNFLRNIGGSVGTALSATMWGDYAARYHAQMVEHVNIGSISFQEFAARAAYLGLDGAPLLALIDRLIISEAYLLSTNFLMLFSGAVMLLLLPVIWLAKPPFASASGGH